MPRPRVHDPDRVLDAVESLAARSGPAAVTIRAIGAATGVSNGAVYHAFGSRAGLVAAAWLRAARRFLEVQRKSADGGPGPADAPVAPVAPVAAAAVVAAADAPVAFAEHHPDSSRLLLAIRRDELLGADLPAEIADQLRRIDDELIALMTRLAVAMWDRRDAAAVDTITTCIVDLPTATVLSRSRLHNPTARAHLHAAVRAVLAVGPPPKRSPPPKGPNP